MMTVLNMFLEPWLEQAERRGDNHISTNWNQVRGAEGGTRTGRPSTSNPNFLNISKAWGIDDGYEHPAHLRVISLPLVRRYMLPDRGEQWLHRDYNGQELRLLAHFEDGPLMEAYQADPRLDVHQHVATLIEEHTGLTFARKNVKIANFRIIYGGGTTSTAAGIGCSYQEAKELLDAHARALPSIKGRGGVAEATKRMGKSGEPLVTIGGRLYYCEPAGYSKKYKRHMTFEYKLLNYECQGSAADTTKEAMIAYDEHPKRKGRFLVQVYDEMNSSSGPNPVKEMAVLRESMESVTERLSIDVPMLSDGKVGSTWGDLDKYVERKSKYE
jgi:DNA polymerase I-like protein with 3'-5' exonuclease and polymerase domains